jgi:hypothetical protein
MLDNIVVKQRIVECFSSNIQNNNEGVIAMFYKIFVLIMMWICDELHKWEK